MKTPLRYATLQRAAMYTEQPATPSAPTLPLTGEPLPAEHTDHTPDFEFFRLYGTLMNVYYLTRNVHFAGKHTGVAEGAISQLTADLSHSLSQLDPLILEALASRSLHD